MLKISILLIRKGNGAFRCLHFPECLQTMRTTGVAIWTDPGEQTPCLWRLQVGYVVGVWMLWRTFVLSMGSLVSRGSQYAHSMLCTSEILGCFMCSPPPPFWSLFQNSKDSDWSSHKTLSHINFPFCLTTFFLNPLLIIPPPPPQKSMAQLLCLSLSGRRYRLVLRQQIYLKSSPPYPTPHIFPPHLWAPFCASLNSAVFSLVFCFLLSVL